MIKYKSTFARYLIWLLSTQMHEEIVYPLESIERRNCFTYEVIYCQAIVSSHYVITLLSVKYVKESL
jgi:hypothetical protein